MADFTDMVLYLSSGRVLAWVGAGPSVEMGLPTWQGLANEVLEACRRQQNRHFSRIELLYRERKYQELFDFVENFAYDRAFIHDIGKRVLCDPGGIGAAYTEISRIDFLGYLTTNYDDILMRHIEDSGKVVRLYRNTPEDLEEIDVDEIPSLVKLHGDFSDSESVVLTQSDYQRVYYSGARKDFQIFLNSLLARDRILFIGYSLTDPELLHLQTRLAVNFKRKVAPIAILPNATSDDVSHWKRSYNIDVIPYRASRGDHSTLVAMLKSVSDVVSAGSYARERTSVQELRRAQALYMWHRFSPSASGEAHIDALQSIVIASLASSGNSATLQELVVSIRTDIGANVSSDDGVLAGAIQQLIQAGWIFQDDDNLRLMPEGERLASIYERQFSSLMDVFTKQLVYDLGQTFEVNREDARRFAQVVLDALIDIFEVRGRNIMEMVFDDRPMDPQGITNLLQILWGRANTLENYDSRASLVGFVLNILINPSGVYENVLNYLARSFFCIQAMQVDTSVPNLVSQVITDRALIIDENILIPLAAKHEDRQEFISDVVRSASASGISLLTTQRFVDSVRRHADWAIDLVKSQDGGTQAEDVLRAAKGEGEFNPNAFLQGFINQDPDDPNRDFFEYVKDCFGGDYSREAFDSYFEDQLGIKILNVTKMAEFEQAKSAQYSEAKRTLEDWNLSRPEDSRKSARRIESEVEVLILIANLEEAIDAIPGLTNSRVSFLTSGSGVGSLARSMGIDAKPMMVVSSDGIWELLTRLEPTDRETPSFRSMMLASHFRMAGHFIQTESYRRFFRPLINDAKREFEKTLAVIENSLGANFGKNYLEEANDEDVPQIVSGLQDAVARQRSGQESENEELAEENAKLRELLSTYREKERKRREFVAHQRRERQARRR